MSLPTSLCSRAGQNGEPARIQRFKLQLFKFWPSQDMKQAWKQYLEADGTLKHNNINALHISLKILETACEQFSVRQAEKMERKNKQAIMQAIQPAQTKNSSARDNTSVNGFSNSGGRYQRAAMRQTVKYFESSEEEDEEVEEVEGKEKDAQKEEASDHTASEGDGDGESSE